MLGIAQQWDRNSWGQAYRSVDFDQSPVTVAWEVTRACALACVHCRASAIPRRDPRELSTAEGFRFIDQVAELGCPILVFTGGDPLMRRDIFELLVHAAEQNLHVALSPSATALVTQRSLARIKQSGVEMLHLSLDGSLAAIHDTFRGVPGSFQRTLEVVRDATEVGLPFQIGTTVCRHNLHDLPCIADTVERIGAAIWSVFFLVPTGRGRQDAMISPTEQGAVLDWLAQRSQASSFRIRTTAAPAFRRVVAQRTAMDQRAQPESSGVTASMGDTSPDRRYDAMVTPGVTDGRGFCFVSHVGDVCPSGFLPVSAGNVRHYSLAELYRSSEVFQALRNPALLKGKCGLCEFQRLCGGSRARAYAMTGDYLAADPSCSYEPGLLLDPSGAAGA